MKSILVHTSSMTSLVGKLKHTHINPIIHEINMRRFSDNEIDVWFNESIRGCYVYLLADSSDDIFELMLTIDTITRSAAIGITVILPYHGYGRQDKRSNTRSSLGAKVVANAICMGKKSIVDKVVTFDLHSQQIQMAYDIPIENISGLNIFLPVLAKYDSANKNNNNKDAIICSPDAGGMERARKYAHALDLKICKIDKHRVKANEVETMELYGDVEGKTVIIIDDIIDTAGTLSKAAELLKEKGAKKIISIATHGILSGKATINIENSCIDELYISDTAIGKNKFNSPKVKIVSSCELLAEVVHRLINNYSLTELNEPRYIYK